MGDNTILALRKRLKRTGFYVPVDHLADAGDRWVLAGSCSWVLLGGRACVCGSWVLGSERWATYLPRPAADRAAALLNALHPMLPLPSPGRRLSIDTLFEKKWDMGGMGYVPAYLEIEQMRLAEAAPDLPHVRTRQVTILHHDGRERPTTYGVQARGGGLHAMLRRRRAPRAETPGISIGRLRSASALSPAAP